MIRLASYSFAFGRNSVPIRTLTNFPSNRCDILPDSEPPLCQHCKQYGFECTFFLPITETRFKKKKLEEDTEKEKVTPTGAESGKAPARDPKRDVGVFGKCRIIHFIGPLLLVQA